MSKTLWKAYLYTYLIPTRSYDILKPPRFYPDSLTRIDPPAIPVRNHLPRFWRTLLANLCQDIQTCWNITYLLCLGKHLHLIDVYVIFHTKLLASPARTDIWCMIVSFMSLRTRIAFMAQRNLELFLLKLLKSFHC